MLKEPLNIPNPEALDLGEALGIPAERLEQISNALDGMVAKAKTGEIRLVRTVDVLKHMEGLCNTNEEFVWAFVNHILWLARTGRLFNTPAEQHVAIKTLGKPQKL